MAPRSLPVIMSLLACLLVWPPAVAQEQEQESEANADPQQEQQASSQPITFDFADPKGVNGISFFLNSTLEPIVGIGAIAGGEVTYDPQDPESFQGQISVDASSLTVVNDRMTKDMLSEGWLNVADNPRITFDFTDVKAVDEADDGTTTLTVAGTLSAAGASIEKEVKVSVNYLEGRAPDRGAAEAGDLLVLRSNFSVSRQDLGIKPDMSGEKVASNIGIVVGIVGYSKQAEQADD